MAQNVSARAARRTALQAEEQALATRAATIDASGLYAPGQALTQDSFVNFAQRIGVGADNATSTASYGFNPITRNRTLLEWIHRGSWIGGLAIDIPADDMTRAGIDYMTEMPPEHTDVLDQVQSIVNFWPTLADVVRWGRLYGGGLGIVLIDGQDTSTPLRVDTVGPEQYCGIVALDRWMVEPSLGDLVTEYGPHLGMPRYYTVQQNAPALRGKRVHYSRVAFRLLGIPLPYTQALTENLWGISVLERVFDRMTAFDSASAGAAQLVYRVALRTLKIKGMRELVASGGKPLEGLLQYTELMRRFQNLEGVTLLDGEDEFEVQQTNAMSGLDSALVQFGQQLSGALQIPLVRLFGQSPSGLNSTGESDLRTYYDGIGHQQRKHLTHGVQLCYRLAAQTAGVKLPPGFRVDFRTLMEMNDPEKAEVASKTSTAVSGMKEAGLISDRVAMKELRQVSRKTGVFTNISAADIEAADDQIQPPAAEGAMPGLFGDQGALPGVAGAAPESPLLPPSAPPQGALNGNQEGTPGAADKRPPGRVKLQPRPALGSA